MQTLEILIESARAIYESAAYPGVLGVVGHKIEKRCEVEIAAYFRSLAKVIEAANLESLATHEDKELAKHAAKMKIHNVVRKKHDLLRGILIRNSVDAYMASARMQHVKEAEGDDEPIDFVGQTAQDASDWAQANVADQMSGIDERTADVLADDVAEGIEEQLGVDGTGRLIRDTLDGFTVSRAKTIASTEMNRSMSAAALKKLKAIEIPYKQLLPSPGACEICLGIVAMGPVPIDEPFVDDDGETYDSSPIHPNCFVGETYISTVSSSGVYKRWFQGEVVRILIEDQRELMLTVNHPILTDHGWVPAGLLKKGTNLIKCIDPMVLLTDSPHDYLVQSLFKEIFDSSLMSSKMTRMSVPGSTIDFHGDGIANQKIDIIPSKSFLEDERNTGIIEKFSKLSFSVTHFGTDNLPRIGDSLSMDIGLFLTPDSGMSFSGDSSPLSRFRHSEVHPFTPVSDRESKFFKRSDGSASIASDLPSEVIRCLADKISVVKVSDLIIVKEFSGHVYNLETKSGWYLAEGIVTHNCRCATTGARAPEVDDGN